MAKQPKPPAPDPIEEHPDAWERFESDLDKVMRGGPQHRKPKDQETGSSGEGPQ